ncbi:UEV-domain-containing protein [Dichomitus squalens]|uniref:UEV-domain-containing protein n=1 Tax=Dichomitus squalens TaxID=114155 RepID=A0A4Q9MWK2_9APHY|nr:UEV-domain-containing protein [Dichomitus squalens]
MSRSESLTHKWLRQNLQPYAQADVVFTHVDAALARHPTIRPKTDVYTYDDGRTQLLLCLHGLLPINFRGASYNIPIAVWLPREYPRSPPIAYVVPTSDMLIRAGPDVDVSGRCSGQYVRNWERKSEGCSLVGFLDAMQETFSREPPVYAKPKDTTAAQTTYLRPPTSTTSDYPHRPPPPLPVDRAASVGTPMQSTHSIYVDASGPPPLPAKPGASVSTAAFSPSRSASVPLPQASASIRSQSPVTIGTPALAMRPPPPLPQEVGVPSQSNNSPVPPSYHSHDRKTVHLSSNNPSWSARIPSSPPSQPRSIQPPYRAAAPTPSPPPPPPLPPALSATISAVTSPIGYSGTSQHPSPTPVASSHPGSVYSPPPPPAFSAPQPVFRGPATSPPYLTSPSGQAPPPPPFPPAFAPPAHPPAPPAPPSFVPAPDLLDEQDGETAGPSGSSAPAAGAPPRPPNPELLRLHDQVHAKLSSELASLSQAMALDAERLRANQTDLLAGEPALRDEMARLEAVRDVCRGVAARLEQVVAAGERNVAELRRKGDPEVDEMICSTTIVYNQLINLVAEDNAIEDTIYHLHRALNAGRVDLERFLRTTRVLAEEQFMKRALIEKIRAGIPLGMSEGATWPDGLSQWR